MRLAFRLVHIMLIYKLRASAVIAKDGLASYSMYLALLYKRNDGLGGRTRVPRGRISR